MSRNKAVFGIGILCFTAGMYFGGILAEVKRPEFPAEEQETRRTWERQEQPPADSTLENPGECYLCGNHSRSLMSMFRGRDDLGVICVNDWYVMDLQIRNLDGMGGGGSGWTVGAEGACSFQTDRNPERGISEVTVEYGENSVFDVKKVQSHLCQPCLDKLLEVMDSYGEEGEKSGARDVCLVDFQTLELYSLQEHYISHYIRDYYVQIDGRDGDELEVIGIYAPVLENGERVPDIAKALENKYN